MPAALRFRLRRHCSCFSTLQLAQKHLERARQLLSTQKKEDVESALAVLESALEQCPGWEKALELKARTLLFLHRFKDVVQLLHEYVPSLMPPYPPPLPSSTCRLATTAFLIPPESPISKERTRLLASYDFDRDEVFLLLSPLNQSSSVAKLSKKLFARLCYKKLGRQQHWRYMVLGQACCHLGMLEDAMLLLQIGKKTASAVSRRKSNGFREDKFCTDAADVAVISYHKNAAMADSGAVAQMLGNIKFLLRRRTAALAALQAGHYAEAARHFTKIIDGRKGSPQGFIADCYLHRAIAYQATGRVVDAIADCNRTLALNSHCTKALSLRACLYEMVRCYSECLLDLQQLKMQYDVSLRYQMFPEPHTWVIRQQYAPADVDPAGGLDYVNSKITAVRQKLSIACSLDAYTILDMPWGCTTVDVKRAYLVLSLKHRPDTATQFLDRCELVDDDRDMETVREEVWASARRLSQLIHKAYLEILSCIAEEKELERQSKPCQSSMKEMSERSDEPPLVELDESPLGNESPLGKDEEGCISHDAQVAVEGDVSFNCSHGRAPSSMTTESVVLEAFTGFNLYTSEEEQASSSKFYDEGRGSAEDSCDFCQPFGGFTTTALANALSQTLLHDLPIVGMATPTPWAPADWSHTITHQPLHVT